MIAEVKNSTKMEFPGKGLKNLDWRVLQVYCLISPKKNKL